MNNFDVKLFKNVVIHLHPLSSLIFIFDKILSFQIKFSKQEEEKRPFYNELSFGLNNDCDVKTKGWMEINISIEILNW